MEKGELGQDKYDSLQREIMETEQSLSKLQDELKNVPNAVALSIKEVGDKLTNIGDKTSEVGGK